MNHCMVDIETLGVGNNAAIVQIGAVRFDPDKDVIDEVNGFRVNVDLMSPDLGEIQGSALKFWLEQPQDAIKKVLIGAPRLELREALSNFYLWLRDDKVDYLWANAPTFDCAILRAAFTRLGMTFPISFRAERCCRTMFHIAKMLKVAPIGDRVGTRHDGLDDAIYQARCVIRTFKALKEVR